MSPLIINICYILYFVDMKKLSQATNDLNLDKTEVLQCDETPECDEKKSFKDFNDQGIW